MTTKNYQIKRLLWVKDQSFEVRITHTSLQKWSYEDEYIGAGICTSSNKLPKLEEEDEGGTQLWEGRGARNSSSKYENAREVSCLCVYEPQTSSLKPALMEGSVWRRADANSSNVSQGNVMSLYTGMYRVEQGSSHGWWDSGGGMGAGGSGGDGRAGAEAAGGSSWLLSKLINGDW